MRKVLIITYYWPPAGGPGVQRVLKFAKYLPEYGYEPIILTVRNGEYPAIDHSLVKEVSDQIKVVGTPIWEPHQVFRKLRGRKEDDNIETYVISSKRGGVVNRLAKFIRLNLFIPDAKIGWYFPGCRAGRRIIRDLKPDIIFSSSPPHTLQLIGNHLAKWSKIPWVADFRDPWQEIVYYQSVKRSSLSKKIDGYFESKVLKNADQIVTISENLAANFDRKVDLKREVVKIPNGFDLVDFEHSPVEQDENFSITYTGTLSEERIPSALIYVLNELLGEGLLPKLELRIVGKTCSEFLEVLEQHPLLREKTRLVSYVPHDQVVGLLLA